jgi:ATP-dependent Clp protease ATP-binding subunit ClpA
MRDGKGNSCIVGEAGVGKTALVEGLAYKISKGDVPDEFKDIKIIKVNMVNLIAGNSYEDNQNGAIRRIRALFNAAKKDPNMILFIDEFHQIANIGAAELFKTYLDRGDVKIIATTTIAEYHSISRDPALERRFTKLMITAPSSEITLKILENFCSEAEKRHNITISPKAINAAVELSANCMKTKNFPDKALDVMNSAIASALVNHTDIITENDIKLVIMNETGIPISKLDVKDFEELSKLEEKMKQNIVGQDEAIKNVAAKLREARLNIKNSCRPKSILFVGTSGVGKSELAQEVGKFFDNQIYIDMSKYFDEKSIYDFLGAKIQGYFGELMDHISKNPYSLIILENIENAHKNVRNIIANIMEKGTINNLSGNKVDFSHAIIVMTTNIGASSILTEKEIADDETVCSEINTVFGNDFTNKIDNIVIFNKLTLENLKEIAKIKLQKFVSLLSKNDSINFNYDDELINYLAKISIDEKIGARKLTKQIESKLEQPISDMIIHQTIKRDQTLNCTIENEKIKFLVG